MILGRRIQFPIIWCFYLIFLTKNTPCRGWRKKVPNTVRFFGNILEVDISEASTKHNSK